MRLISLACLAASTTGFSSPRRPLGPLGLLQYRGAKATTFETGKSATALAAGALPEDLSMIHAPSDDILERSTRALGLCVLMQFFTYLPSKKTTPRGMRGWNETRLDGLRTYLSEAFWAKTNRAAGDGLPFGGVKDVFQNEEVIDWVDLKGDKKDNSRERRYQEEALAGDASDSSFELVHLRVQDREKDGCFCVVVDDNEKRVTVAFRGSQFQATGGLDLINNLKFWTSKLRIPFKRGEPEQITFGGKPVKVHAGYDRVLFGLPVFRGRNNIQKPLYTTIKETLAKNFVDETDGWSPARRRNKGQYSLSVTGHSLGGALATLAGLAFADDPEVREWFGVDATRPVEVLAFANPPAGDMQFVRKFEDLEARGLLRSVSLRSADDPVPNLNRINPFVWSLSDAGARIILNEDGLKYGKLYGPDGARLFDADGTKLKGPKIRHLGSEKRSFKQKPLRKIAVANHFAIIYAQRVKKAIGQMNEMESTLSFEDAFGLFFPDGELAVENIPMNATLRETFVR